jgi:hypothetical protein
MDERTEQPALPDGVASPVPPFFYWTLWIGVFAVITWGMMLLFGRRPWDGTDRELTPRRDDDRPPPD